jgi:hypothetical protein
VKTTGTYRNTMTDSDRKRRKVKALPIELALLTDEDRGRFDLSLEIDANPKSKAFGEEFLTAQSVRLQSTSPNEPEVVFDLKTLTVDHLRKLCTNIGIVNCGSHNKFNCRKAIATYFRYQNTLERNGLRPTSHASRVTSTICRAVNVVFSAEFIEDFKTVNDRKSRRDHETKNTYKAFWIRAALAHNSCLGCDNIMEPTSTLMLSGTGREDEDDTNFAGESGSGGMEADSVDKNVAVDNREEDRSSTAGLVNRLPLPTQQDTFCSLIFPPGDVYLADLVCDTDINLLCVDQFETEAFRKKIMDLFKIRRKMKQNMTESGTHDSDPWNFVECAMSGISGFTKMSVYYFYQRCEENIDIDGYFQPFLDLSMRGDTVSLLDDDDDNDEPPDDTMTSTTYSGSSKKRAKQEDAIIILQNLIQEQGGTIIQHLANAAEDRKAAADERKSAAIDRKKKMKFHARLEVAKALGDTDELRKLMEEAKSMDDD